MPFTEGDFENLVGRLWNGGDSLPPITKVLNYMKALGAIGHWVLQTKHKEAAREIKDILFANVPEILNPEDRNQ